MAKRPLIIPYPRPDTENNNHDINIEGMPGWKKALVMILGKKKDKILVKNFLSSEQFVQTSVSGKF